MTTPILSLTYTKEIWTTLEPIDVLVTTAIQPTPTTYNVKLTISVIYMPPGYIPIYNYNLQKVDTPPIVTYNTIQQTHYYFLDVGFYSGFVIASDTGPNNYPSTVPWCYNCNI